jgi:hypothetical protein
MSESASGPKVSTRPFRPSAKSYPPFRPINFPKSRRSN